MALSVMETISLPYSVKAYDNFLFRVTKRLYDAPVTVERKGREKWVQYDSKLDCNMARARSVVRELALCNHWDYFVTLTLDGSRSERYDLQLITKKLMQWLQNLRKTDYPNLRYLLIPEKHKKKDPVTGQAWHFHGFISGVPVVAMPPDAPKRYKNGNRRGQFLCWRDYWDRFGLCALQPVGDPIACGFYCIKYITKTLATNVETKGVHCYYHSRGLGRALTFGYSIGNAFLDSCLKHENVFYRFGYFRVDERFDLSSVVEEVSPLFASYIVTDENCEEVISIIGGYDEDEYFQELIAGYEDSGFFVLRQDMEVNP